jgi:1-acyl-sn-glycerol-3-phosphate acyltransferase
MGEITYPPPKGYPLGVTSWFRFGATLLIPLIKLITKREWRGNENIPKTGAAIVVSNHISYFDPLVFAHFLYGNGRAPRFLGKSELFKLPIIGTVLRGAGQVPVERETENAKFALHHAVAFLKAGHLLGVYPEGTLTRDPGIWPMKGKTGIARLAIMTKVPVIPCAQWGAQELLPPYSKRPFLFPRKLIKVTAGPPLDFSQWYGREDDIEALNEATTYVMDTITGMVETLRGEKAPAQRLDPRTTSLPRTGNFRKKSKGSDK